MRTLKFVTAGLLTLLPAAAHATANGVSIGTDSMSLLCNVLPCGAQGGGVAGLSAYVLDKIVTAMEVGVIALAIFVLFTAARWMVQYSSDEGIVKEARSSYIYVITGLVVVALARWLVRAFSPVDIGAGLINHGIVSEGVGNVVTYFKLAIAITLMVNIVLQAFRMITSQGAQEQVDKAKNRLIAGFIGAGIIMLANAIVAAVEPSYFGATGIAIEIAGIANYLLVILGFLSLLAIVVAGILLIVSVDESLKDKAKNIVKTSLIGLVIVLVSYALVTAFLVI